MNTFPAKLVAFAVCVAQFEGRIIVPDDSQVLLTHGTSAAHAPNKVPSQRRYLDETKQNSALLTNSDCLSRMKDFPGSTEAKHSVGRHLSLCRLRHRHRKLSQDLKNTFEATIAEVAKRHDVSAMVGFFNRSLDTCHRFLLITSSPAEMAIFENLLQEKGCDSGKLRRFVRQIDSEEIATYDEEYRLSRNQSFPISCRELKRMKSCVSGENEMTQVTSEKLTASGPEKRSQAKDGTVDYMSILMGSTKYWGIGRKLWPY